MNTDPGPCPTCRHYVLHLHELGSVVAKLRVALTELATHLTKHAEGETAMNNTDQPDVKPRQRRPQFGECPYCEAREDDWCAATCPAIDPMDYR